MNEYSLKLSVLLTTHQQKLKNKAIQNIMITLKETLQKGNLMCRLNFVLIFIYSSKVFM